MATQEKGSHGDDQASKSEVVRSTGMQSPLDKVFPPESDREIRLLLQEARRLAMGNRLGEVSDARLDAFVGDDENAFVFGRKDFILKGRAVFWYIQNSISGLNEEELREQYEATQRDIAISEHLPYGVPVSEFNSRKMAQPSRFYPSRLVRTPDEDEDTFHVRKPMFGLRRHDFINGKEPPRLSPKGSSDGEEIAS